MELALFKRVFGSRAGYRVEGIRPKSLAQGEVNRQYVIKGIDTDDEETKSFLFTLGCFEGEVITVISRLAENLIIHAKGARYSIDLDLAKAILV